MKKLIALFALFALVSFIAPAAQAQERGLSAKWIVHNYKLPATNFKWWDALTDSEEGGVEVAWHDHFGSHIGYSVPLRFGTATFPFANDTRNINQQGYVSLDALLRYSILRPSRRIVPYVQAGPGVHYNTAREAFRPSLQMNGGLNLRLAQGLFLSAQTEYRLSLNEKKYPHGLVSGIGLTFDFGNYVPKDTDGDGLPDKDDKCPTVAGKAQFMGCPDSDGDGIQDSEDKCPTVAGVAEFMGCPDMDGDHVQDSEDKCPTVAGVAAFMGCPDTDGDGIQDADDKCPNDKGEKVNRGCPDSDGDGIVDGDDRCPTAKGSKENKGCPDGDGDGVVDIDDKCPKEKGPRDNAGCPKAVEAPADRDKDGTPDTTDKCPDKAGPKTNQGCPEMKVEEKKKLEFAMRMVQFETNQSTLKYGSTAILDEIVSILNAYPEVNLRIEGHTDSQGDDAKNQALSESRARTCLEYMASKGIARSRMTSAGFGETRPVADNKTKEGRDLNRRVEFNTFY